MAAGNVKEDSVEEVSGQLDKHDVDAKDTHTWSVNDAGKGQYGTFTVDQNGKWTYVLDNKSTQVQALAEGQKVTDTITVTVDDGKAAPPRKSSPSPSPAPTMPRPSPAPRPARSRKAATRT